MVSAKDEMTRIIEAQPDDISYEQLLRELAFSGMVERGLQDSLSGRTIEDEEMRQRISEWEK
jgi:hypothetical protein